MYNVVPHALYNTFHRNRKDYFTLFCEDIGYKVFVLYYGRNSEILTVVGALAVCFIALICYTIFKDSVQNLGNSWAFSTLETLM